MASPPCFSEGLWEDAAARGSHLGGVPHRERECLTPHRKPREEARGHRDGGRARSRWLDGTLRNAESPSFRRGLLEQARECRDEQDWLRPLFPAQPLFVRSRGELPLDELVNQT